nr:MAG TPA: restriction enzyme [Caudoviricetes sp.]
MYELPERKNGKIQWRCRCDCGNEKDVLSISLTSRHTQSCGCLQKEKTSIANKRNIDLVGHRFGRLVVLSRSTTSAKWICRCDCGNLVEVTTTHLKTGHTKSCGCLQKDITSEVRGINLNGQRFGLLIVEGLDIEKSTSEKKYWVCQCDCGNRISVSTGDLRSGNTQSCGCSKLSHGEMKIKSLLEEYNIPFEQEKSFPDCVNPSTNRLLRFDFFVNNQYLIEFDGKQHYEQSPNWEPLEDIQRRDRIKDTWCKEHNITLIRIPYTKLNTLTIEDLLPKRGR